ncbi:MAG: hypothetical protein AABX53_02500 [Nanoarchaeota archaeon]
MTAQAQSVEVEAEHNSNSLIYKIAPWGTAVKSLYDAGAKVISSRDLADARIALGSQSSVSANGSYTKEGFIYVADQKPLVVAESPLLDVMLARGASDAHKAESEVFYDAKDVFAQLDEDANKAPQDRRVLRLKKDKSYSVPTNRFGEDELALFLFKDRATAYGTFLRSNDIKDMPVWVVDKSYIDKQGSPFVRQLWLHRLDVDNQSVVYGDNGDLDMSNRVRGVRPSVASEARVRSAESTGQVSENSELAYDPAQISEYQTILQEVRKGDRAASDLEQVLEFINGLPVKK